MHAKNWAYFYQVNSIHVLLITQYSWCVMFSTLQLVVVNHLAAV